MFLMPQVTSLNSMSGILEDALREYNETYATMDLVLFEDAMKHVRVSNVFAQHCIVNVFSSCQVYSNLWLTKRRGIFVTKEQWHLRC